MHRGVTKELCKICYVKFLANVNVNFDNPVNKVNPKKFASCEFTSQLLICPLSKVIKQETLIESFGFCMSSVEYTMQLSVFVLKTRVLEREHYALCSLKMN